MVNLREHVREVSATNYCKLEKDYLFIHMTGWFEDRAIIERVHYIRDKSREFGAKRVLVDTQDVQGRLRDFDRWYAGLEFALTMPGSPRVAVLALAKNINKFGENVAVNRGADLLVTHDRDEAVTFLLFGRTRLT